MYLNSKTAVKNRILSELEDLFKGHPHFSGVTISNKYADVERGKEAIIITGASVEPVILQANHHVADHFTYCFLAPKVGKPGYLINWIREDSFAVAAGKIAKPGFYFLTVTSVLDVDGTQAEVYLDPLYRIDNEILVENATGYEISFILKHFPIEYVDASDSSLEVFDATRTPLKLLDGMHYTYDNTNGKVTFTSQIVKGAKVTANYRYVADPVGPFKVDPLSAHNEIIPGVIVSFGEYFMKGDQQIVAVTKTREFAAEILGGRFLISLSIDIFAQDPEESSKLSELVMSFLWDKGRDRLANEGVMIENVTNTGETQDLENETAQEFYFGDSMDLTISTEWERYIPYLIYLKKINLYDPPSTPDMTDEEVALLDNFAIKPYVELPVKPSIYNCERIY